MSIITKDLRVKDLHAGSLKRQKDQEILFDRLIETLNEKITVADNNKERCLMYEAPQFIPMYPHYDVVGFITYAITHYRKMGFDVRYSTPNILYIFWNNPRDAKRTVQQVETLVDENRKTKIIIERIRGPVPHSSPGLGLGPSRAYKAIEY